MANKLGFPHAVDLSGIDIRGLSLDEATVDSFQLPELMPIGFSLTHLIKGIVKHLSRTLKSKQA